MTGPEQPLRALVIGGDEWREAAACRDAEPDLHHGGPDTAGKVRGRIISVKLREAVRVCNGDPDSGQPPCPVRDACLLDAFSIPAPYEQAGVWGGMLEVDRRRLIHQHKGASPAELLILARTAEAVARAAEAEKRRLAAPVVVVTTVECARPGCGVVFKRKGKKRYCSPRCGSLVSAASQRRTHCPRGHAMTDDNITLLPGGRRSCTACIRLRNAAAAGGVEKEIRTCALPSCHTTFLVSAVARKRFCSKRCRQRDEYERHTLRRGDAA